MSQRAVPRPAKSVLAQPPTPIHELDLQDLELCGEAADMTRSIEVPADLLAQMRVQLAETLGVRSEAEIDDRTVVMSTSPDTAPLAFAATQEAPTFPPPPDTVAPLARRARPFHVFLVVMLGLLVSGGEVLAAKTLPHFVAKVARR